MATATKRHTDPQPTTADVMDLPSDDYTLRPCGHMGRRVTAWVACYLGRAINDVRGAEREAVADCWKHHEKH